MIALSGAAAVVGVLVAIMATGIVTVLAPPGSPSPRSAEAARILDRARRTLRRPGDTGIPGGVSPDESPVSTASPTSSAPPPAEPASVSPSRVRRSSHSAVPSPPDFPTPALTTQPGPTATSTATLTATPTASGTASPTFTIPATPPT